MPRKKQSGIGHKHFEGYDKYGVEKWTLRVDDGIADTGQRKRPSRMFHGSSAEADKALVLFAAEVLQGQLQSTPKKSLTVREWAHEYLKLREAGGRGLAKRTLKGYRDHLEDRIIPALGNIPLSRLTSGHIKQFMHMLESEKAQGPRAKHRESPYISGTTQLSYYRTLSAMLQEAVYQGHIPTNPIRDVRAPKADKKIIRIFDGKDLDRLLAVLQFERPRDYAMWMCALGLGLRRGELTALRWDHIHWNDNFIVIEQSIEYISGEGENVKQPKSDAGVRVIPMPRHVRQALEYCLVQQQLDYRSWHKRKQLKPLKTRDWRECDYVFTRTTNGGRLHIEYVSTAFDRFLAKHGLPHVNLHNFRHDAISIWRSGGLSAVDAAALAGHGSITTTNIYSHAFTQQLARSADIMDNIMDSKMDSKQ